MPAPYSVDLRQRVINSYKAKEGSKQELAERFKVSLSFVQRLIRRYQETGGVKPTWRLDKLGKPQRPSPSKPRSGGARAIIKQSDLGQIV
jgi:transposase